ncbi:MAG: DNA polymerase III subunit beta [Chitinispirillaceae bacterium]
MSVLIQKKDLFEIMQKAYPLIPTKSSLQILSNFKLTYTDSLLEISATDLDHSLKVTAKATGDAPFDITVNARKIFEIVRELPDGVVTLDIDETVLLIESEKGFTCKIAGADSNDFPGFPQIEAKEEFEINTFKLREMIAKSAFAVSKDESRACLCGILWEIMSDRTGMVATDGHRLGSSFISNNFSVTDNSNGILSPKSVMNLVRIIDAKNQEEVVKVLMGEKYIIFNTLSFTMCSKLIDGPYPDYTKVIPRNNPKFAVVDRTSLQNAVKRVSVLSNQKNHLVKFVFKPGALEIVVLNREIGGEARESIAIEYDGDEHVIGFNGQYFSEILDIIKVPKVKLEMNTQISACLLFPVIEEEEEKTSEDLFLIMPLRIMDEVM